jgi:hypothetical protein
VVDRPFLVRATVDCFRLRNIRSFFNIVFEFQMFLKLQRGPEGWVMAGTGRIASSECDYSMPIIEIPRMLAMDEVEDTRDALLRL